MSHTFSGRIFFRTSSEDFQSLPRDFRRSREDFRSLPNISQLYRKVCEYFNNFYEVLGRPRAPQPK